MVTFNKSEKVPVGKNVNIKHGPYIAEFTPAYSLHKVITAPMIGGFGGKDMEGNNLAIGFGCLPKPFTMIPDSHKHDFDQFLMFFGGDPNNFLEFDAEVELTLDGQINLITYACWVFIPKGLMHCPLIIKRVGKPIIFCDARLTKEASVRPAAKKIKSN
jgi:hypothetical protein